MPKENEEYELKRNPSFTPSPSFRDWLNERINRANGNGPTAVLNQWHDLHRMMVKLSAIKLNEAEVFALQSAMQGTFIEPLTVQYLAQEIEEHSAYQDGVEAALSLHTKLEQATFGQKWATLEKHGLL